jgi:hypothetical protein
VNYNIPMLLGLIMSNPIPHFLTSIPFPFFAGEITSAGLKPQYV